MREQRWAARRALRRERRLAEAAAMAAGQPSVSGAQSIYLWREAIDFRRGINGIAVLVESQLRMDPFSTHLFAFTNKRRDKIKILYWERSGFCLWQKRLERERFKWPLHLRGAVITLSQEQLDWLLDGLDLKHLTPHAALEYHTVL